MLKNKLNFNAWNLFVDKTLDSSESLMHKWHLNKHGNALLLSICCDPCYPHVFLPKKCENVKNMTFDRTALEQTVYSYNAVWIHTVIGTLSFVALLSFFFSAAHIDATVLEERMMKVCIVRLLQNLMLLHAVHLLARWNIDVYSGVINNAC